MENGARLLAPALLLSLLLCGTAGAADLFITVQDSLDQSPIPYAAVYKDGSNVGRTTTSGTFVLWHTGDEDIELKIIKSGYEEWKTTISANATDLVVSMKGQAGALAIELYDADTLAPVSGATVEAVSDAATLTGTTNETGVAVFHAGSDTVYSITVTATDYQTPAVREIEIQSPGTTTVQYWLVRNDRFSFVVTDGNNNPVADAGICLDGKPAGTTDSRGILIYQVMRDTSMTIEVKKDGFLDYLETRAIGEDEAVLKIVMTANEAGSPVYSETETPISGTEVSSGMSELTIFIRDRDQHTIRNASISLNGASLGLSDTGGEVVTSIGYNIRSTITAQKDGYQTASITTTILPGNETASVTIILERNPDLGFLVPVLLGFAGILLVIALIQRSRKRKTRHIIRRNEI